MSKFDKIIKDLNKAKEMIQQDEELKDIVHCMDVICSTLETSQSVHEQIKQEIAKVWQTIKDMKNQNDEIKPIDPKDSKVDLGVC